MGVEFQETKSCMYTDFKIEETRDHNTSLSSDNSSGFNTPFHSELGSSESDHGDFAAQLSRQMAEFMLHEEEEEEETNSVVPLQAFEYGSNSNRPVLDHATRIPRTKVTELTRQMKTQKREQNNYGRYTDGDWKSGPGRKGHTGSGIQAVFLGRPGSGNGSSGTGVFLPRVNRHLVERKKKPGLSTVLIPTRVLEVLEHHFTRLSDSASSHHASPADGWMKSKMEVNVHAKMEMEVGNKVDEMQILPQEWTY